MWHERSRFKWVKRTELDASHHWSCDSRWVSPVRPLTEEEPSSSSQAVPRSEGRMWDRWNVSAGSLPISSHNSTGLRASAEHVYIHSASVYILLLTTVYIYLSPAIFHLLVPSAAGPRARRLFCTYLPSGDESWGIPAHRSASRWWRCGRRSHAPDEPVSASSCITLIISNRLHVPYEALRWVPTPPTHFQCVPQFSHLPRLYDWCRSERRLASPLLLIPHFLPAEPEVDSLICLAACQVASAGAEGGGVGVGGAACWHSGWILSPVYWSAVWFITLSSERCRQHKQQQQQQQ